MASSTENLRSDLLLESLLKLLSQDRDHKIFRTLFHKNPRKDLNLERLKSEFFILLKPWMKDNDYELWNLSLAKLQETINASLNQNLRFLILEIIYSLLIESKRKPLKKLVAKTSNLTVESLDYFFKKYEHFEILKMLCSHNKLQPFHFEILENHARSQELFPVMALNEGLPQSLTYRLIKLKDPLINHSLMKNEKVTIKQKLNILENSQDNYLWMLFLEQSAWPENGDSFWTTLNEKLLDSKNKESLEVRLFYKNHNYPLCILLKQKKFLKNKIRSGSKNLEKKLETTEEFISKHSSSKGKLSKIFN